jgi:hypothetical protein
MDAEPPKFLEVALEASEGPLVRALAVLLSAIGLFIEFRQAGLSLLFWILLILVLIALSLTAIPLFIRRSRYARLISMLGTDQFLAGTNRQQVLRHLIIELSAYQKAKLLSEVITVGYLKVVSMMIIEGKLGALINAGQEENLKIGTPLLFLRILSETRDNEPLELRLGILQVTYVQARSNLSQAVLVSPIDWKFWNQTRESLKKSSIVQPPQNIILPYIPQELDEISSQDFRLILNYLNTVLRAVHPRDQSIPIEQESFA